jgi:hypothetical protein
MTTVLEARQAFDDARADANEMVARKRALLGRAMIRSRKPHGPESQESIARALGIVSEQVRRYEQYYRDWLRDHDGQEPDA